MNDGSIRATGGAGGSATATAGGDGGVGRQGFLRIVNAQDNGYVGGDEDPPPFTPNFGQVRFDISGSTVLLSKSYDIRNTAPTYTSTALSGTFPAATTTTLEWAGSSDNFVSDNTGFVTTSNLAALAGKRYVKFRATLSTTSVSQSPDIRAITLDYTPRKQVTFTFGLAGCARVGSGAGANPRAWLGLAIYLVSLPIWAAGRRARRRRGKRTYRC